MNNDQHSGIINPIVFDKEFHDSNKLRDDSPYAAETEFVGTKQNKKIRDFILRQQNAKLNRYRTEHWVRIILAFILTAGTITWMSVIIYIIVLCGRGSLTLSEPVLITLITTTTANIGIFLFHIIKYMFNQDHSS